MEEVEFEALTCGLDSPCLIELDCYDPTNSGMISFGYFTKDYDNPWFFQDGYEAIKGIRVRPIPKEVLDGTQAPEFGDTWVPEFIYYKFISLGDIKKITRPLKYFKSGKEEELRKVVYCKEPPEGQACWLEKLRKEQEERHKYINSLKKNLEEILRKREKLENRK